MTVFKINYKKDLNKEQYEAVTTIDGPLMIISGAGTGKTRTLTYRVARLIEEGVEPDNILLLTFTKKAANEMVERAKSLLDERCEAITIGTYHSFAANILRHYGKVVGLRTNFSIMDKSDSEDLIEMVKAKLKISGTAKVFPTNAMLNTIFSTSFNKSISIEEVVMNCFPKYIKRLCDIEACFKTYEQLKKDKNVLDYDDLLKYLDKLLKTKPSVAQKLSEKYKYIMVDEYQDSNLVQSQILKSLCITHQNLMVVGDELQSIYGFRGSEVYNILNFPKTYPSCKIVMITENYRSSQAILNLTNGIIENAIEKYPKKLLATKPNGNMPVLVQTRTSQDEAFFVANAIYKAMKDGISLNDCAVLCRNAYHSAELEIMLNKVGIPYNKVGGIKFLEQSHIKDFIAYLKVIHNVLDEIAWFRLLMLIYGIGPKNAEKILQHIQILGYDGLKHKTLSKLSYFKELEKLYDLLMSAKTLDFPNVLEYIFSHHYKDILYKKYEEDADKRELDVQALISIGYHYKTLEAFLTDIILETPETLTSSVYDKTDELLTISTIHSAKGLEWENVFILKCADEFLPSAQSMGSDKTLEEERRLFYVAVTRARQNLYMMYPEIVLQFGKIISPTLTQFLREPGMSRYYKRIAQK